MDDLDHVMRRISRARPQIDAELVRRIAQFSTRCVGEKLYWKYDPLHRTQSPMPMLPTIVDEFWSRHYVALFYGLAVRQVLGICHRFTNGLT